MNTNDNKALERIEETIKNLKENNFTFYFFVVDCKNVPNGNNGRCLSDGSRGKCAIQV